MNPEHWHRVKTAFQAALDGRPSEAILDPELAAEVTTLLAAHQSCGAFLETPAPELIGAPVPKEEKLPERLGPWKILNKIGRGGMADVYLVERCDGHFEMKAAVKVLRTGIF